MAKDGNTALKLFNSEPNIDLILMDIRLPDYNGFELSKKIKESKKGIIIIAQTAYASAEDKRQSLAAGCDAYLSKPIVSKELMKTLIRFLG